MAERIKTWRRHELTEGEVMLLEDRLAKELGDGVSKKKIVWVTVVFEDVQKPDSIVC